MLPTATPVKLEVLFAPNVSQATVSRTLTNHVFNVPIPLMPSLATPTPLPPLLPASQDGLLTVVLPVLPANCLTVVFVLPRVLAIPAKLVTPWTLILLLVLTALIPTPSLATPLPLLPLLPAKKVGPLTVVLPVLLVKLLVAVFALPRVVAIHVLLDTSPPVLHALSALITATNAPLPPLAPSALLNTTSSTLRRLPAPSASRPPLASLLSLLLSSPSSSR